jgi:hypothetical protein
MPTLGAAKKCFTSLFWPQQFFLQIDKIKKIAVARLLINIF